VMRCLRCAIEYGPDEQFCQRCGRALSRPLGEKPPTESTASSPTEARFFYTTTTPPPLQPGNRGEAEKITWETPIAQAAVPAAWGTLNDGVGGPNSDSEPGAGWNSWAAGQPEDRMPPPSALRALPSLPSAKWVDSAVMAGSPPKGDAAASPVTLGSTPAESLTDAAADAALSKREGDFFGDDDDDEGSALVVGGVTGSAASTKKSSGWNRRGVTTGASVRSSYSTKAADRWSKPRSLALVAIVAVVIIALGGYAFTKQRAYNTDLTNARSLAVAGQYTSALTDYNKAIADWPFNADAKAGANAVRDAAAAVQEQAQAAALTRTHNNATRQGMYQAHMALIQQEVAGKP
jgi:hypothetical protein